MEEGKSEEMTSVSDSLCILSAKLSTTTGSNMSEFDDEDQLVKPLSETTTAQATFHEALGNLPRNFFSSTSSVGAVSSEAETKYLQDLPDEALELAKSETEMEQAFNEDIVNNASDVETSCDKSESNLVSQQNTPCPAKNLITKSTKMQSCRLFLEE